jgi:protein involved in sex pheromone biosynthesis
MKKHIALGLVASTLFLAGCCTSHHSTAWEYKTSLESNGNAPLDEKLNKLAVDGWMIQSITPLQNGQPVQDEQYLVFLKRPKQ